MDSNSSSTGGGVGGSGNKSGWMIFKLLLSLAILILAIVILMKVDKNCGSTNVSVGDYPVAGCAYNDQYDQYGDTIPASACAWQCNNNLTAPSGCCDAVCDKDSTTGVYSNCDPADMGNPTNMCRGDALPPM